MSIFLLTTYNSDLIKAAFTYTLSIQDTQRANTGCAEAPQTCKMPQTPINMYKHFCRQQINIGLCKNILDSIQTPLPVCSQLFKVRGY